MAQEITYYYDSRAHITSARAVLEDSSYAIADVTGTRVTQSRPDRLVGTSVLFVVDPLTLPLVATLPMVYGFRSVPFGWPLGLYYVDDVPKGLVYVLGAIWLLLAGWLVTRRSPGARSRAT
jgi:hypothetical protein